MRNNACAYYFGSKKLLFDTAGFLLVKKKNKSKAGVVSGIFNLGKRRFSTTYMYLQMLTYALLMKTVILNLMAYFRSLMSSILVKV